MTTEKYYKDDNKNVFLTSYILDTVSEIEFTKKRPAVLIFPGGGYYKCSDREAEPIAMKFISKGYNAFVLNYSVLTHFPVPLTEAAWAMNFIRSNASRFMLDKSKIAVCGFSAGAHLAGMISTMYNDKFVASDYNPEAIRPDASVLCYPVIDGTRYSHTGSFDNLLGTAAGEDERRSLSLQYRVTEDTPPSFLWHTANDDTVPVQNSLLFSKALADKKIPFELHIFDDGIHGLSTCDRTSAHYEGHINSHCAQWFELACTFLEKYL